MSCLLLFDVSVFVFPFLFIDLILGLKIYFEYLLCCVLHYSCQP